MSAKYSRVLALTPSPMDGLVQGSTQGSLQGPAAGAAAAGGAVRAIEAHVGVTEAGKLDIRYVMDADLSLIRIPPPRVPRHTDELWKHTCFEAFLRNRDDTAYQELNFSPSTQWAVYSFTRYRTGMAPVNVSQPPDVRLDTSAHRLQLDVRVDVRGTPAPYALALAAVIEERDGRLSYWALKHAPGKPDFHHPDSFSLEL